MTEIKIWDVQHGSATYIKSPNNKHIVVDVGMGSYENGDKFSPLYYLHKNYGVKQIDCAILTHPHKDHLDDIEKLILLEPKVLCCPNHLTRNDIITAQTKKSDVGFYEKYIDFSDKYNNSIAGTDNDFENISNYGNLQIQTFVAKNYATSNLNNHSIISIFSYANSKVVITGDNENASYEELLQNLNFKDAVKNANILVASHHGRESGYHDGFVKLVNPNIVIVSDSSKKDTSVADDYCKISKGWSVFCRKDNTKQERKTLSTYNDGIIDIKMGYNNNKQPFLEIRRK